MIIDKNKMRKRSSNFENMKTLKLQFTNESLVQTGFWMNIFVFFGNSAMLREVRRRIYGPAAVFFYWIAELVRLEHTKVIWSDTTHDYQQK